MIKARGFSTYFTGTLADFTADTRVWPKGVTCVCTDSKQIREGDGLNQFIDLLPIWEQNMTPSQHIALIGVTTNFTAPGGVFADLAAARAYAAQHTTESEARMDIVEAKLDALLAAMVASGGML